MFCGSSSRCRELVCIVRLWYFLIILTYFFVNEPTIYREVVLFSSILSVYASYTSISILCMQTAMALATLLICSDSPGHSLLNSTISFHLYHFRVTHRNADIIYIVSFHMRNMLPLRHDCLSLRQFRFFRY